MTTRTLDLDKLHLRTGSHDPNDEQRMCVMEAVAGPDEYVIVHSGRLAELFGKWGLPPWGDEMLGEDVDCGPLISLIGDDYEALLRSTPTLLVDMLADALALPERTCVEDRAVHLIAEVGHKINPRSDTFRRNLRRPDEPCDAEIWSWDLFTPRQVDAYWIGCDRVGPHDEHHDNHTGAVWSDDRSATVPERTNR